MGSSMRVDTSRSIVAVVWCDCSEEYPWRVRCAGAGGGDRGRGGGGEGGGED